MDRNKSLYAEGYREVPDPPAENLDAGMWHVRHCQ